VHPGIPAQKAEEPCVAQMTGLQTEKGTGGGVVYDLAASDSSQSLRREKKLELQLRRTSEEAAGSIATAFCMGVADVLKGGWGD